MIIVPNPRDPSNADKLDDQVPINEEVSYPFESELFKGEMLVRIKGLANEEKFAQYLGKKKRAYEVVFKVITFITSSVDKR